MLSSTPLLALLALLTPLTSAINAQTPTGNSTYSLQSYVRYCDVPGECHYNFTLSGHETEPTGPSFSTECRGIEEVLNSGLEGQWVACEDDKSVSTFQEFQAARGMVRLEVRHLWRNKTEGLQWVVVGRAEWPIGEVGVVEDTEIEASQKGRKNLL